MTSLNLHWVKRLARFQVTHEHALTTAKRLHVCEKSWAKLANHFSIMLSDKDAEVLSEMQVSCAVNSRVVSDVEVTIFCGAGSLRRVAQQRDGVQSRFEAGRGEDEGENSTRSKRSGTLDAILRGKHHVRFLTPLLLFKLYFRGVLL